MATLTAHCPPGQTHSGLPYCDHRPSVQAQSADNHGMESPSRDSRFDLRLWGSPHSGQVCHIQQFSAPIVHVSDSAVQSTGSRYTLSQLGRFNVHVSFIFLAEQGLPETWSHSERQCLMVAISTVVSASIPAVCRSTAVPPVPSRSVSQPGHISDRKSYNLHPWRHCYHREHTYSSVTSPAELTGRNSYVK